MKSQYRAGWDEAKVEVLTDIIRTKILQHEEIQDALLATGDEEIVEINPNDGFWGNGPDGKGQNHTGRIWMRIRDELRNNQAV